MAHYIVRTPQIILAAVLTAAIGAGSVIMYQQWKEKQTLPEVQMANDKCVKVVNFRNGDAYNCEDVDVVLRVYKKVNAGEQPEPAKEPTK